MKIFNFLLVLKIVSSSVSELLSDNDDISDDLLLMKKRTLPSEFDKELRFKINSFDKNCRKIWLNLQKSFLNALNAIMKGAADKHGTNDDNEVHKRNGLHIPENQDLLSFLTSV